MRSIYTGFFNMFHTKKILKKVFYLLLFFLVSIVFSYYSFSQNLSTRNSSSSDGNGKDNITSIDGVRRVVIADPRPNPMYIPPPKQFSKKRNGTQAATFVVNYTGFTAEQQTAFQYAVDIWASLITSSRTIYIDATFAALGPGILGSCGPSGSYRWGAAPPYSNTWYAVALAEKIKSADVNTSGNADIEATFSTGFAANLYFGTDGACTVGKYDFVTLVLHELCHGLGYVGSMDAGGGSGSWGNGSGFPYIFDRFLYDGGGVSLLNTVSYPNPSAALAAPLTGSNVYWTGTNTGTVQQYAPGSWSDGSSIYHLAESYNGSANALMTYSMGTQEVLHNPGTIVLNQLSDMGWGVVAPPATYTISGTITASGSALSGATVGLSGSSTSSTTTNASGNYSFTGLTATGDYTITPSKTSYTFTPSSRIFTNLSSDQTGNFTASGVPVIGTSSNSISYGTVIVGNVSNQNITISNTGTATLNISALSITGANGSDFTLPNNETSININASSNYVLTVRFTPSSSGNKSATLSMTHNASGSPKTISLSGTGQASTATISANKSSISFGSINYGSTALTDNVTISNTSSTASLNISSISITGSDTVFKCQQSTPIAIPASGSTILTLKFYSDSVGSFSKTMHVLNSSSNTPDLTVTITGTVTGSTIAPAYTSVNFGTVGYQTGDKDTTIRIANSGAANLKIYSSTFSISDPAFEIINPISSSGTVLSSGSYYDLKVRFHSDIAGAKSGTISLPNNSSNTPALSISLSGTVVQPSLTITPTSVSFGTTATGTPSISKTVQIKNTGATSITISSKTLSGDGSYSFTQNSTPVTLVTNQTDEVIIKFFPVSDGSKTATLNIISNDIAPTRSVSLTGTGGGNALISSSLSTIDFSNMVIGTSKDTTITITNNGNLDLVESSKSFIGNDKAALTFISGGSISNLQYQQSETIKIRFTASLPSGNKTAQLQINSNDPTNASLKIDIKANAKSAVLTKNKSSIIFDSVMIGNSSNNTFTLKNTGNEILNISSMNLDGSFASDFSVQGSTNLITLNPDEEKVFTLIFSPAGTGTRFSRIVISSNDPSKPEDVITLRGTGKQSNAPTIAVDNSTLNFGNVEVTKYVEKSFVITNSGNTALHIDSLNIVGTDNSLFTVTNSTNSFDINAGATKQITVKFLPISSGTKTATLRIKHNASSNLSVVSLSGLGLAAGITINPQTLNYGDVKTNSSKDTTISIFNNGAATLSISNLKLTGSDASLFTLIDASTPINITSGNSYQLKVRFAPVNDGTKSALLEITHNASGSPGSVQLSGNGVIFSPNISISSSVVSFGDVIINSTKEITFTISNTGNSVLSVSSYKFTGTSSGLFSVIDGQLPANINPGNNLEIKIRFAPTSSGSKSASLEITHNASGSPSVISLSGSGFSTIPTIVLNSTSAKFGTVNLNSSKDTSVIISNSGNGTLIISSLLISGSNPSMFSLVSTATPISIEPGNNYILKLRFTPTSEGLKSGSLSVAHNATGSPTSIDLSGTGFKFVNSVEVFSVNNYLLSQNYPNPFNPSTRIEYALPENSLVSIYIYNSLGVELQILVNRNQEAGRYVIDWHPDNLPSGVYYYKLQTNKITETKKMLYMR